MCGIAGIINKNGKSPKIKAYLDQCKDLLHHRGPDGNGTHTYKNNGFLNLRLAIVDRAGGQQPIFNNDQTKGIVFNGEIYNYMDIRRELIKKGYTFKTKSDTEVILRNFEERGVESFAELNGMFAFCVWDEKKNEIYLARDRFGIKPLYIYEDAEKIIFASEIKAILGFAGVDDTLEPIAFLDYLTFRYVQSPYTFFKKIRRLEAGTYAKIKNTIVARYRFADISYRDPYPQPPLSETKKELEDKIKKAVSSQLMGEVPVGVLLSGGIDSSTIAYMIHTLGANLLTFNIGFPEVNEFEYSRAVAKRFGLKHIEIEMTVDELIRDFDKVNLALDEPIGDAACLPLYRLAAELKKHVTVVLSGEGGDELLAGYPQYHQVMKNLPPYEKRFDLFFERSWYFSNAHEFLNDPTIPPLHLRFKQYFEEQPTLNGMLAYDMRTWMPENLMMKADKILMAHSLEGRFPFLDRFLFDYVSRLPQEYKLAADGTSKWILKEVMKKHLPSNIINRQKMGFTVPVGTLLKKMESKVLDTIHGGQHHGLADIVDVKKIQKLVDGYYKDEHKQTLQVWTFFVFLYWFNHTLPIYKKGRSQLLPARS